MAIYNGNDGGDDHEFLLLTQDCFLTQHVFLYFFVFHGKYYDVLKQVNHIKIP